MRPSDVELVRLAVARGWLDQTELVDCLEEADRCQAMGLEKGAGEVLVERGHLTQRRLWELQKSLGWYLERPRIGGFEIIRRVGVGGTGSVFEARHVRLGRRVALKVLYPRHARSSTLASAFVREARVLARLDCPHLVHVFDVGKEREYYYLAMEYVDGENLQQHLVRAGPIDPERSVGIVRAVCSALLVLEQRGLVHRDVKPANILLAEDGGVKLADLGLLSGAEPSDSDAGGWVCGTPHYVAPEVVRGDRDIDIRSDLYSLAATWYHVLAGRPPFVAKTTRELLQARVDSDAPPLRRWRAEVPPALETVLAGWLEREPADRPVDCAAALAQLERLQRRMTVGGHGFSPSARRRFVVGAWITIVAMVIVAVWIGTRRDAAPQPTGETAVAEELVPVTPPPTSDDLEGREKQSGGSPSPTRRGPDPVAEGRDETGVARTVSQTPPPAPQTTPPAPQTTPPPVAPGATDWIAVARVFGGITARESSRVARAVHEVVSRLRSAAPMVAAADRRDRLASLLGTFHARRVSLAPGDEDDLRVLLVYDFDSERELHDFRAVPGACRLSGGALVSASPSATLELSSVAWFAPPFRVRARLGSSTRISASLGELDLALATEGPGVVSALVAGEALRVESSSTRLGRFRLELRRGSLVWLEIESRLDPTWVRARLRALAAEESSEADADAPNEDR